VLIALAGSLVSCLLLGAGLYWKDAAFAAVIVFVASMLALLIGALYYIAEVRIALSSVRDEAKDVRFMDLGEVHNPNVDHHSHP
jgi:hypothetical protein